MEEGTLLLEALKRMDQLRNQQESHSILYECDDKTVDQENIPGSRNALRLSLYILESDDPLSMNLETEKNRVRLLQELASLHEVIHSRLLPLYCKKYKHNWFLGGDGISFGLHCSPDSDEGVPHLKALIYYGPNPLDMYYSIALMHQLTIDLKLQFGIKIAVDCWDIDDGQILLIEASDCLPPWIDDLIGVEGMRRRVYIVEGRVIILPPFINSNSSRKYELNRRLSLSALISVGEKISVKDKSFIVKVNNIIQNKIRPFLQIFNHSTPMSNIEIRTVIKEYVHTAAVVVPLSLAMVMRKRPDLIPCAVLMFCESVSTSLRPKKSSVEQKINKDTRESSNFKTTYNKGNIENFISFENLVFTTISLSKTLYAMLLTAAGQKPPPIKIPRRYKSVELNRVKRQCIYVDDRYSHFRHAVEAGIRLCIGFEFILGVGRKSLDNENAGVPSKKSDQQNITVEERINTHIVKIEMSAGGDGNWIHQAWKQGPNGTSATKSITGLVKCPVWDPEIRLGGICPLTHPSKPLLLHVQDTIRKIQPEKDSLTSIDISKRFSYPRADDVDGDSWIDFNSINELDKEMENVVDKSGARKNDNESLKKDKNYSVKNDIDVKNEVDSDHGQIDNVLNGLNKFIDGESQVEGIATLKNQDIQSEVQYEGIECDFQEKIKINPLLLFQKLNGVLNSKSSLGLDLSKSRSSEIVENLQTDQTDLKHYFCKNDMLAFMKDEDIIDEVPTNHSAEHQSLKVAMRAMDEELAGTNVKQSQSVSMSEGVRLDDSNNQAIDENCIALQSLSDYSVSGDVEVLSNLLKSLDSQNGGPGPVSTLLREMNIDPPKI